MNDANSQKKATLRLNHYIAACGQCSRRDADRLIEEGRVEVNGSPGQLGQIVTPTDVVTLDGRKLTPLMIHSSYLYYKPRGIVCTSKDPHAKLTITEELKRLKLPSNLTYAGRLDKESEGVLLLTNDGALVERVSHGAHGHEKEYLVEVDRKISGDSIRRIREGVYLPELARRTSPCLAACPLAIDIPALTELEPPELRNSLAKAAEEGRLLQIVLKQGLNRQIRRTCRALGYTTILHLLRIRIENLKLGDLQPGQARALTEEETDALHHIG